jgi:hypothetical protein
MWVFIVLGIAIIIIGLNCIYNYCPKCGCTNCKKTDIDLVDDNDEYYSRVCTECLKNWMNNV